MITVDLTTKEWQSLWALCVSEMDEDIKSVARKLTIAIKEESSGKKENN